MSSVKCGGHCCERFCTTKSPREWKRAAKLIRDGDASTLDVNYLSDFLTIADMLILVQTNKRELNKVNEETGLNYKYVYTCKHFDTVTRLCTDYDNRPEMCRSYPENTPGGKCKIENCQCK